MNDEGAKNGAVFLALLFLIGAWLLIFQFRLISLPFLLVWVCLCLSRGWHQRDWLKIATLAVFFASTFSPVDLYVPGWSGPHYGKKKTGTRLVRQVKGKPAISHCLAKYGEFIAGGCCVTGFEAPWLLVLDWSAEPNGSADGTQPIRSKTNQTSSAAGSRP